MEKENNKEKKAFPKWLLLVGGLVIAVIAFQFLNKKPKYPTGLDADLIPKTGLVDALLGNDTKECKYIDENGEVTFWAKSGKMRAQGASFGLQGDQKGGMINDGEYLYIWQDSDKSGIKYKLSVFESADSQDTSQPSQVDPEAWAQTIQGRYKYSCNAVNESDSMFTPPSDIEFKDMTDLLEKAEEFSQTFSENDSQEDMDKKMEEVKGMMDQLGQ